MSYTDQLIVFILTCICGVLSLYDCPPNCLVCRDKSRCKFCGTGFYGLQCEEHCGDNCQRGICSIDTGHCDTCNEGWKGDFCNEKDAHRDSSWNMNAIHALSVICSAMFILLIIGCICVYQRRQRRLLHRQDIHMGFVPPSQNLIQTDITYLQASDLQGNHIETATPDRNSRDMYDAEPPPYCVDQERPLAGRGDNCTNQNMFHDVIADIGTALPPDDISHDSSAPPPSYQTLFPSQRPS